MIQRAVVEALDINLISNVSSACCLQQIAPAVDPVGAL
jgi:hypothetical protein